MNDQFDGYRDDNSGTGPGEERNGYAPSEVSGGYEYGENQTGSDTSNNSFAADETNTNEHGIFTASDNDNVNGNSEKAVSRSRIIKNVIFVCIIAAMGVCMAFTMHLAKNGMFISSNESGGFNQTQQTDQNPPGSNNSDNSGTSEDSDSSDDSNGDDNSNDTNDSGSSIDYDYTDSDSSIILTATDSSSNSDISNSDQNSNGQRGGMGDSQKGGQPPDMNGNGNSNGHSGPPDMNGGSSGNDDSGNSSGNNGGNSGNGDMQMPDGNMQMPGRDSHGFGSMSLGAVYYVLFGAESLIMALAVIYLIMSRFNLYSRRETFYIITGSLSGVSKLSRDRILVFALSAVLLGGCLTQADVIITNKAFLGSGTANEMQGGSGENASEDSNTSNATGANEVDGTEETLNDEYTSSNSDENVILVKNGGVLTSDGAVINKKAGDSSNTESSDFSGVNSGVLVTSNSSADIKNAEITTSAKGANAVFATGTDSEITISDSTIKTTGEGSSRGLDATYGGKITASNVDITTEGGSCASLATDRGEGTVTAADSTLETNGTGSPLIYSTGDITLTGSKGTANNSQMVVVEGKNTATVKDSTLTCSGTGNRGDVDVAGVMIYQSMSGDASEGTGTFTSEDSTLTIDSDSKYSKTAPMFFVTNTDAEINLKDTALSYQSGILLSAEGTDQWGTSGSNGGNVTLNAEDQTLTGDIELDDISTLSMTLSDSSSYEGTINGDNTAKSIELKLSSDSKITLTGDSYVSSLDDEDSDYSNIDFNGYKLYVDGTDISK